MAHTSTATHRYIIVLCIINLCLLSTHIYLFNKQRTNTTAVTNSPSNAAQVNTRQAVSSPRRLYLSDQVLSLAEAQELNPTRTGLKASLMNDDELVDLSSPILQWFDQDEEAAVKWLSEFSDKMIKEDAHDRLAFFLGYLNSFGTVREIERKTFSDWMQDGSTEILSHFSERLKKDDVLDPHHVSIAVSLALNEHSDQAADLIKAVSEMDSPEQSQIQGVFVSKFLAHAKEEEHLHQVIDLIEENVKNPRVAANLLPVARYLSVDSPENTLEWISQLPVEDDDLRAAAFATVFEEVTYTKPDSAAEILSGESFLNKYFHKEARDESGQLTAESKDFFDLALESYVSVMLADNPALAVDSAGAFFDPEKQTSYKEMAEAAVKAQLANQSNDRPHGPDHNCDDCSSCKGH